MSPYLLRVLSASLLAMVVLGTSCRHQPKPNFSPSFNPASKPVTKPSEVKVKISTKAQRVYVVQGDEVLLATPCSVGTAQNPTPRGTFRIYEKSANRRRVSQPGAGYPMTFWMEFKSAYGMHWGWVKPYPCTHGCVRLPIQSARKIFEMVRKGTPLIVADSHPEDATHGAKLPVLDDSALANPPDSYMMSPKVFEDAKLGKIYTY
jgi:hypothetical protein